MCKLALQHFQMAWHELRKMLSGAPLLIVTEVSVQDGCQDVTSCPCVCQWAQCHPSTPHLSVSAPTQFLFCLHYHYRDPSLFQSWT